jgi:hypothetical protein
MGEDSALAETWPAVDRRQSADRRAEPTRPWQSMLGLRRRHSGRRAGEVQNSYVDVYARGDTLLIVSILVLNILDAFLTIVHLQRGGEEANPIMDSLLQWGGYGSFLFQKCAVVGSLLILLMVHKNFKIARLGMWTLLAMYVLLFGYHLMLQTMGNYPNG